MKAIFFPLLVLVCCSCTTGEGPDENKGNSSETKPAPPVINYVVTHVYPHDTTAFTEGLLVYNGKLFESTGSPNELPQTRSLFGPLDTETGFIDKKVELDRKQYFGEGIAFLDNKVYQLTYLTQKGFVYDAKTFQKIKEFTFPSKEGWGLTTDGRSLIMSDGSSRLTYLDPRTFQPIKTLQVSDQNGALSLLNELEFFHGAIYANVYTTSEVVRIDTGTGAVTGRLNLASLVNEARMKYPASMEMNGIAFDSVNNKVYVTGKMWPNVYEIRFSQ